MLNASGIGMHLVTRNGTVVWANQALLNLLGCEKHEYVGQPLEEFLEDDPTSSVLLDCVTTGRSLSNTQVCLRQKSGEIVCALTGGNVSDVDPSIYSGWFLRDVDESVRAREALRRSEERYRAFIRNSSEGIWRCELDHPIDTSWPEDEQVERAYEWAFMAECNQAMARMYGFDHESALDGVRLSDLFVRSDPKNEAFLRAFIRSGYELREAQSHERDVAGNDRYFINSFVGVVENGILLRAWGTQRDVTEQKRTDLALRETQERFSRFMTHLPGAAWIKNIAGQYVYANPEAERVFHRSAAELIGKTDKELFPDATAEQFAQNDHQAIQQTSGLQTIELLEQPDGTHESLVSKFPILDEQGLPIFVGGVAIDITERRRAQSALAQSEERLDLATAAAKIGTFDWNIPSGRVVWNQQEEQLFGLPPGTFEGTIDHWTARVHQEDAAEMHAAFANAMAQRLPGLNFAFRIVQPDNTLRWLEGAGRLFYDANGDALRMVGVNIDMTERRESEMALRRLNAELEEFAYAVSHDLKEPLRMVQVYTQMLLRRHVPDSDFRARDCAHFIQTGVQRMETLLSDLLAYSKTIRSEDHPTASADLNASLAEALLILDEPIRTSNAALKPDWLPTVGGDENHFTEVFQNLISNSLKYRHPDRLPEIDIRAHRDGSDWIIRISDNGIGFDPQYAERIFGLFKRLHTHEYPGTGLGLAICKRIVERHHGTISAEGALGTGSTFIIRLPRLPDLEEKSEG
jgi:PAS domain S-box-containing protein